MPVYKNRQDAGRQLARFLAQYEGHDDVVVLGLPRGGVPVAYEVAQAIDAPLDVLIVRKLGVPGYEELAMGAIASGGAQVIHHDIVRQLSIPDEAVERVIVSEKRELERRENAFRGGMEPLNIRNKIVILVDDGLATGATMKAAVEAVYTSSPNKVVVAVPIASPDICDAMRHLVDEVICAATPQPFHAVGLWYTNFEQTTDDEVKTLLQEAREHLTT
jgi:putative phosphoribosyl transferase